MLFQDILDGFAKYLRALLGIEAAYILDCLHWLKKLED